MAAQEGFLMMPFIRRMLTENVGLKIVSLILAVIAWFYIVDELHKGTSEEEQFIAKMIPSEGVAAKKLPIKTIFIGKVRPGYEISRDKIVVSPDYCIVVGTRELLGKIRFAYTTPIDVSGANKSFTKSVPLNPIAPGIFMEETLVQVTVPVDRVK